MAFGLVQMILLHKVNLFGTQINKKLIILIGEKASQTIMGVMSIAFHWSQMVIGMTSHVPLQMKFQCVKRESILQLVTYLKK